MVPADSPGVAVATDLVASGPDPTDGQETLGATLTSLGNPLVGENVEFYLGTAAGELLCTSEHGFFRCCRLRGGCGSSSGGWSTGLRGRIRRKSGPAVVHRYLGRDRVHRRQFCTDFDEYNNDDALWHVSTKFRVSFRSGYSRKRLRAGPPWSLMVTCCGSISADSPEKACK